MSILSISYLDAYQLYNINEDKKLPDQGYVIASACPILRGEIEKIEDILYAFRALKLIESEKATREDKFQRYVAWRPQEEWAEIAEYSLYRGWKARLETAKTSLDAVKTQHQVTKISLY